MEQTEEIADRLRDDLVLTLKELDRRKDDALDFRRQLSRHLPLVKAVGIGVGVLVVVSVGTSVFSAWRSRNRLPQHRRSALLRAWEHPDRLATRASDAPFAARALRQVAGAVLITLATQASKRAIRRMLPAKAG